jgi:pyruvate dehydrogenase E2 component (dihydrolipoyllysine-residue acetyltransferase)
MSTIEEVLVPHSRLRRATAKAMTRSAAVPQFTLQREVSFSALAEIRAGAKRAGSPVSVTDLLVAAVARALREHPGMNASYREDGIVLHQGIHIGLALALEAGLIVVRLADADQRSLDELAAERARLQRVAREGDLAPDDVSGVTFTISNLGTLGVTRFTALVNPPQAGILAVGAPAPTAAGAEQVCLSLSCDHRALDGAPAAAFLATLAAAIEAPAWLRSLAAADREVEADG